MSSCAILPWPPRSRTWWWVVAAMVGLEPVLGSGEEAVVWKSMLDDVLWSCVVVTEVVVVVVVVMTSSRLGGIAEKGT